MATKNYKVQIDYKKKQKSLAPQWHLKKETTFTFL